MLYSGNINKLAAKNHDFRRVVATGPQSQLVTMRLPPKEDIGKEVHPLTDQILFIVSGTGKAVVNDETVEVREGDAVFVPAGAEHDLINSGPGDLALYTVYSPPNHAPGTVHRSKTEALAAERELETARR